MSVIVVPGVDELLRTPDFLLGLVMASICT